MYVDSLKICWLAQFLNNTSIMCVINQYHGDNSWQQGHYRYTEDTQRLLETDNTRTLAAPHRNNTGNVHWKMERKVQQQTLKIPNAWRHSGIHQHFLFSMATHRSQRLNQGFSPALFSSQVDKNRPNSLGHEIISWWKSLVPEHED